MAPRRSTCTNEKTVLVRNPYHYAFDQNKQRLPYLDELVILVVPDQDAADLKFRAGGVDAVDDVKPENYQWYEENQKKGNFTLYDLGASQATHLIWFNLNKVQPPVGGAKPTHGKRLGEPFVDPVKYEWFNNRDFRRAVSMAIDRDAIIKGVFFGYGEKNWSQIDQHATRSGTRPISSSTTTTRPRRRSCSPASGFKDTNGDGFLEDARGNQVSFMLKTNSSNALRVSMANFIRDDLAKVGVRMTLTPIDFNTLITNIDRRLPVRGHPARVPEQRAADAVRRPERLAVVGRVALSGSSGSRSRRRRRRRASIARSMRCSRPRTAQLQKASVEGNPEHHERAGLVHLAADLRRSSCR